MIEWQCYVYEICWQKAEGSKIDQGRNVGNCCSKQAVTLIKKEEEEGGGRKGEITFDASFELVWHL